MKINELKINSFGKIKNKEIKLEDGINVIYGNNEAGKSTILNFIINSFYGISKNKKGKVFSDYEKYKPWDTEEFSGKIEYELDSKQKYEIYRDFNKKNPKIFNESSEDITKEFNIDKKSGSEFFYEQTKVDEDLFTSTVGILQKNVELEKNNQNYLIQKLANLVGTGEDNVSYKRAIDRINRRQLGEIGTDRSREKPINIITKNIEQLELEKNNLQEYQNKKYEIAEDENNLIEMEEELENKNNYLKELKLYLQTQELEKEKIKLKENIERENAEKINSLEEELIAEKNLDNEKIEKYKLENKKAEKEKNKLNKKLILFLIILIAINLVAIFCIENNMKYLCLLTLPVYLIVTYLSKNKLKKKIDANKKDITENEKIKNLENELNILKANNKKINSELTELSSNFNLKNNLEIERIKNKYKNNLQEKNLITKNNLEEINYEKEKTENDLNKIKVELHKLKLDKENVEPQLDKLAEIEEQLILNKNSKNNLNNLNTSIEIAKNVLEESYIEMKENITPKFTNNLSQIISVITNNKYNKIKFNDENGIMVELSNGDYTQVDNLSTGTIEQLYLALRISMIDELSEEKLPLFLDETFAYYDDERLTNILIFLLKEAQRRQIFIFSCSKREIDILNSMNIKYNLVEV